MSNLEHLIENGLCRLSEGKSYRDWREIMQQDCNWEGNENITIDNLWEICQYVIFTWDSEKTRLNPQEHVEQKKGFWLYPTSLDCHCSVCGAQPEHEPGYSVPLYDYCPYCGAEMAVKRE